MLEEGNGAAVVIVRLRCGMLPVRIDGVVMEVRMKRWSDREHAKCEHQARQKPCEHAVCALGRGSVDGTHGTA